MRYSAAVKEYVEYGKRLGELRGALDYMHDNRYDDYDKSIPKIFVETYKAAYKRGYDVERMASQF